MYILGCLESDVWEERNINIFHETWHVGQVFVSAEHEGLAFLQTLWTSTGWGIDEDLNKSESLDEDLETTMGFSWGL